MADYAVVVMSAASRHCGSARISATDLAQETGIALPTTQKLVSILSKAGLLRSARGTGGGIQLARPAAAITLADIVEAVEGPIALTSCVDAGSHNCAMEGNCRVQPHWAVVNDAVRGALAGVSLVSLTSLGPFVQSPSTADGTGARDKLQPLAEVESPIGSAIPIRISTSLDANGI